MDETELERIVVKLVGDSSSYEKMLSQAQTSISKTEQVAEQAIKHVDGFGRSLNRFAEASIAGLELYKVKGFLKGAFDEFAGDEQRMLKLSAAIEQNGRNADAAMEKYDKFGAALNKTTGHSKDATQELLLAAESMGQHGKDAEDAAKNAIYLAAAIGGEAQQYIMVNEAIKTGNAHMLGRIRQLRGLKTEEEKIAKVQALVRQGEAQAKVLMESSLGVLKRYGLAWDDLYESFGEVVSKAVKPVVSFMSDLLDMFNEASDSSKQFIMYSTLAVTALLSFGPAMALLRATGVPLWDMMNDGIHRLGVAIRFLFNPLAILRALLIGVGAVFSPLGLLLTSIGLITALWIDDLGGVANAWEEVKKNAQAFWHEVKPIFEALESFLSELWKQSKETFRALWQNAKEAFQSLKEISRDVLRNLGLDAEKVFGNVRDNIVTAIEFAEFSLTHFGMVAKYTWTALKLGAAEAADFIANNIFYVLMVVIMKRMITNMVRNWSIGWVAMYAAAFAAIGLIAVMIGGILVEAIRKAFKGEMIQLEDVKKIALGTIEVAADLVFENGVFDDLKNMKEDLKKQLGVQGAEIGQAFEKWQLDKWWKKIIGGWAGGDALKAVAKKTEQDVVPPIQKVKEELKALDAVTVGSGEAIRRLAAYRDQLMGWKGKSTTQPVAAAQVPAPQAFVPDVQKWMDRMPGLQKELDRQANKVRQAQEDFDSRQATKAAYMLAGRLGSIGLSPEIVGRLLETPKSLKELSVEKEMKAEAELTPVQKKIRRIENEGPSNPFAPWGDPTNKSITLLEQIKNLMVKEAQGDTIVVKRVSLV